MLKVNSKQVIFSEFLEKEHKKIYGWCSKNKAQKFYDIITGSKAKLCVEIGVFEGSSFIPQALAVKHNDNNGILIGIDPWTQDAALEDMESNENKNYWSRIDMNESHERFMKHLKNYELNSFCKIYKFKSESITNKFEDESIDVLHIDGNHCENTSYKDSFNYLPKVKKGGYVFFDDIFWSEDGMKISTEKSFNYLKKYCETECIIENNCLVLKKN